MGVYVNPLSQTKETWLESNAKQVTREDIFKFNYEANKVELPIVLLDNGPFTAAAVLYNKKERTDFDDPLDDRAIGFYIAEIEKLKLVSNL